MNNNGNLSPGRTLGNFNPRTTPFETVSMIAAYWGDVDTQPESGGTVSFRLTFSATLLQRALNDIQRAFPSVSSIDYLFIATWDHVGYFPSMIDKV